MLRARIARSVFLGVFACTVAADARASVASFTSKAAFDAATTGLADVAVVDFDDVIAGTLIPSDTGIGAVTFSYAIGAGAQLLVIDAFETTSGLNSLGITDDLSFLAGDGFSIGFPPATAVGLFVIGEDTLPGDIALGVGANSVANGEPEALLADGSSVYFLGLVESDPALAFESATLTSTIVENVGDFVFNVDDIRLAPEPAAALGSGVAVLALAGLARRLRA